MQNSAQAIAIGILDLGSAISRIQRSTEDTGRMRLLGVVGMMKCLQVSDVYGRRVNAWAYSLLGSW